ncbi:hypothetical protein V3851_18245 [Paenibacillus sp. M1]|uniref:Uncharacterized protein n=1 Tax=Paenibacillus haidiansis TaxID=1574488 RepID=A0ABU7VVJ3_9BACL
MQTRIAEQKPSVTSAPASKRAAQTSAAKAEKKPAAMTAAELKRLIDRVLANPDSVTRAEYAMLVKTMGYRSVQKLLVEGKQRQNQEKLLQLKEVERTVQAEAVDKENPQQKEEKPVREQGQQGKTELAGQAVKQEQERQKYTEEQELIQQEEPQKQADQRDSDNKASDVKGATSEQRGQDQAAQAAAAGAHTGAGAKPQADKEPQPVEPPVSYAAVEGKAAEAALAPKPASGGKVMAQHADAEQAAAATEAAPSASAKAPRQAEAAPGADAAGEAKAGASAAKEAGGHDTAAPEAAAVAAAAAPKEAVKAPAIHIKGENPGAILEQLGSIRPTEMVNAFSSAVSVSGGALEKQRRQAEAVLPRIPAPTGLPAGHGNGEHSAAAAAVANRQPKHGELSRFNSEKQGGAANHGLPGSFPSGSEKEDDPDEIMDQAREFASHAPGISLTGEADPSQLSGFQSEAGRHVQGAKKAELAQTQQDFGENRIAPKRDSAVLKATHALRAAAHPAISVKKTPGYAPEIASRINPDMQSMLHGFMESRKDEYNKGKAHFDTGMTSAKSETQAHIEGLKSEAKEKQRHEQAAAKAEVQGYRDQWKSEINDATAEYDREAGAASAEKRRDIDNIKKEKEGEVKKTLSEAEKDAAKEVKSAKKDADEKKKEGEKDERNGLQKAWGWIKDKANQAIEGLKKAVNFIFTQLRKAVKTIFEKAKAVVVSLIEKGRQLIVKAIQGLGKVLKGLVNKVFAKFPGIAKRICGLIDRAVNKAIQAVNKAADLLKKGVTVALNAMAKTFDTLLAGVQTLYNKVLNGIKTFLNSDFKAMFGKLLEAAEIAAEIALAFATGGGSVLLQIVKWLATTLPQLFRKATAVMGFVNTLRNLKIQDLKQFLSASGVGGYLVKGLFGELKPLPVAEVKDDDGKKEDAGGREEKGLMKVFQLLMGVFKTLQGAFGKVAGAINKVLPAMNISVKPWFNPFSMIYAGVMTALEAIQNPGQALNEGTAKLKEAAGSFFKGIKTKVTETAGSIKEKVAILGQPALLMKTIANKAVDMVLNFIITHPPSALIKAVFKGIEAVAGKSIVELVRQYIPFADKLFDKIAASGPVQGLMKPLEQPVQQVGGMIDQVTDGATGMVDDAEQKTGSFLGSGSKLLTELSGGSPAGPGQEGAKAQGPGQGGKGGAKESAEGEGGDFLGTVKSGIHVRLLSIGKQLLQSGKKLVLAGADKAKDFITGLMVRFNIKGESHKLWIEKQGSRNVVMMASTPEELSRKIKEFEEQSRTLEDKAQKESIARKIVELKQQLKVLEASPDSNKAQSQLQQTSELVSTISTTLMEQKEAAGVSEVDKGTGQAPIEKKSLPEWLKKRFQEGEEFNKANRPRYESNEVEVIIDGKKYRVDSYNPGKEIVSRKYTQLSEINEKTGIGYLNEFKKKYSAGTEISDSPFNPTKLKGKRLDGELILEVPVQNKPIPQSVLDAATEKGITIRDVTGKEYN